MTQDVFEFETEERDGVAVVRLAGELDLAEVGPLQAEFDRLCANGFAKLTVDLSELDFLDSTGLHVLLRLGARCAGEQLRCRSCRGRPRSSASS